MRIGEINQGNYKYFLNMLQNFNRNNAKNLYAQLQDNFSSFYNRGGAPNRGAAPLPRGAVILPNGDELLPNGAVRIAGMNVTGRSDWRRFVPVAEKMAQREIDEVKKSFYRRGGMSSGNMAEVDAHYDAVKEYLHTVDVDDRASASWTLNQVHLNTANALKDAVKARVPGWDWGQAIDPRVLDDIFSDPSVTSKFTEGIEVTPSKGMDYKV